jgi:hypothetical protein
MSRGPSQIVRYANELVGGVQVASIVVEVPMQSGSGLRIYLRRFFFVRGGELRGCNINCGIGLAADETDKRDMEAFVGSLAFDHPFKETS